MGAKRFTAVFCVFVLSASGVYAGNAIAGSISATTTSVATVSSALLPSSTELAEIEPWIHGQMPEDMRSRLEAGFAISTRRMACRAAPQPADPRRSLTQNLAELVA